MGTKPVDLKARTYKMIADKLTLIAMELDETEKMSRDLLHNQFRWAIVRASRFIYRISKLIRERYKCGGAL